MPALYNRTLQAPMGDVDGDISGDVEPEPDDYLESGEISCEVDAVVLPRQRSHSSRIAVVSFLCTAGVMAYSGFSTRPGMSSLATSDVQIKAEEEIREWTCQRYADGQDDDWCKSVGTENGYEYSWPGPEADLCGECWCCKRPVPTTTPSTEATTSSLAQSSRSRRSETETSPPPPPPTEATTLPSTTTEETTTSSTTEESTLPPTTSTTELSEEAKALIKADEKATRLGKSADAIEEKAGEKADKIIADATEQAKEVMDEAADESNTLRGEANDIENVALEAIADQRMCLILPGTKLKFGTEVTYKELYTVPNITDSTTCRKWCEEHESCQQAVSSWDGDFKCTLFSDRAAELDDFGDTFESVYCGLKSENETMTKMLDDVLKTKPWVPPNPHCTWAGGDCSESHCCAQTCNANLDFSVCEEYTCYVKDQYFSGCAIGGPPAGWNGTALGGHGSWEVPQAAEGQLTQGTSLFCFTVVTWEAGPTMPGADGEGKIAEGWKAAGLSILQCEEYAFFDGWPTGSVHNIDSFTHAWQLVKDDGRWRWHDWTVKVDADAVFFPERLRWHIQNLRTPRKAAVYLRNNYYKFHFMGALEVLTREAVATYFENSWQCDANVGKEGGEDYWLLQCLEGIGVYYQSDYDLLWDRYAAQNGCASDWSVAFHYYKSVNDWMACYEESQNNWNNNHQSQMVMKK